MIGAIAALFMHKNDKMSTYAAFLSASVASIIGIIFAYTIITGETYSFTVPGSSILALSLSVDKLSAFFIFILSLTVFAVSIYSIGSVSYTHLRAHETRHDLVCRLLLEKKK